MLRRPSSISIHLMLRFISTNKPKGGNTKNFNTSHVTVYPYLRTVASLMFADFNTSHVTVYPDPAISTERPLSYFNTSHVTVYPSAISRVLQPIANFNTSHVTVYQSSASCSRSSWLHFNTSHVTVYLHLCEWSLHRAGFQYISCYGLSHRLRSVYRRILISIHLMLRFICVHRLAHVDLFVISIHLMLRFIFNEFWSIREAIAFQYISCYGLSTIQTKTGAVALAFQYISCYGLSEKRLLRWLCTLISIHLMLRFIVPLAVFSCP